MPCRSVLVASPVVSSPTPAPSSLETSPPALPEELLCLFIFFPCLFSLPPLPPLCSPPGKHYLFFKPQHLPLPSCPRAQKELLKEPGGKSFLTAGLILTSPSGCFPGYQGSVESKIGSIVSNWAVHWDSSSLHTKKKALNMTFFRQTTLKSFTQLPLPLLVESTI